MGNNDIPSQEIININIMFALFLGLKIEGDEVYKYIPMTGPDTIWGDQLQGYTYRLTYHKSYDELLPVWYKFKDLEIPDEGLNLLKFGVLKAQLNELITEDNITKTYNKLTEAIIWYSTIIK
jgi:hypothetical protein